MRHTFIIFSKLCDLNFKRLLTYRASFLISMLLMGMWVFAYALLIEVIFSHTPDLAGWGKGEVLMIMTFYYLVQNLSDIFFKDDIENFGELVRRGDLDLRITKPAPTRLLSFFWTMRFDHTASLISTGLLFAYALHNLEVLPTLTQLAAGFGLMLVALLLYFSILSLIATFTFWISKNDSFNSLIFNLSQLARYPRQIYTSFFHASLPLGFL